MIDEFDGDEGILAIFLAEAEDIVRRLAGQLGELQYGYDGQGILDDIHRDFHTLYGGARVLELASLAELSLLGAEVMQRLRSRRIPLNPGLIGLIVETVDALSAQLTMAQAGDHTAAVSEELTSRLMQVSGRSLDFPETPGGPAAEGDTLLSAYFSDPGAEVADHQRPAPAPLAARRPSGVSPSHEDSRRLGSLPDFSGDSPVWWRSEGIAKAEKFQGIDAERTANDDPSVVREQRVVDELSYFSRELNWVRDLMLQLQDKGSREERRRAIEYLDLLAKDVEKWAARLPAGNNKSDCN